MSLISDKLLQWENQDNPLAPLSERQLNAINVLADLVNERPLPTDIPLEVEPVSLEFKPAQHADVTSNNTGLKEPSCVENVQQFYGWFSELESEVVDEEDLTLRSFIDELAEHQKQCDQLLVNVGDTLSHVEMLHRQYLYVSNSTNSLHEACEQLLADQTKLVNTGDNITTKLSYFSELQNITQKLGSPSFSVLNESFVSVLTKIDECIAYLNSKPNYKESEVFLLRFKACLARALGMIKIHVTSSLEKATQLALPKVETATKTVTDTKHPTATYDNAFTLFYGKFRTNAPRIKSLIEQIEDRVEKSDEYAQLLTDCHSCYFQQRETLLGPSVTSAINDLAASHRRDHCSLVRSGCAFLIHVCEDEHQLFYQFFSHHSSNLDSFLDSLCNKLYDVLRPLVIHVNHLETLAELCSILKVEMLEEHVQNAGPELSAFGTVVSQMLEDVQERLVYRTHMYIRSDILQYNPAPGDLAYPEKLQMMENIAESLQQGLLSRSESRTSVSSTNSSASQDIAVLSISNDTQGAAEVSMPTVRKYRVSPADLHGMWYPTVRRTLVCLSKLYRCIDRAIFQGLSQEVLGVCIRSLIFASDCIGNKKTKLDGQLFLIKHLLILREQIAPFQVDFSIKETSLDFSNVRNAAYGLLQKRNQLFLLNSNNAVLEFILQGTPHVSEHFIDSKKDVDNKLKTVCEEFIFHTTRLLVGGIQDFVTKANVVLEMHKGASGETVMLRNQPFATAEKVADVVSQGYKQLKNILSGLHRSLVLYLANGETEHILFRPVRNNIHKLFEQFIQIVKTNYPEEDQLLIGCPSLEQIDILINSTMAT